jgi:ribokinase
MTNRKIMVIGSSNTDMVIKTKKLPSAGETILGGDFFMNPGGKGANQAVAAARLGGDVILVAKTGNDIFGKEAKEVFKSENVDTRFILSDPDSPSGVALITVDADGENCIVVAPGSNSKLIISDIEVAREEVLRSGIILMQLEIPFETVMYVATLAFDSGIKFILNPAPAVDLPDNLLEKVYILTPNETEAELLTGIKVYDDRSAGQAASDLRKRGVKNVIITMGAGGSFVQTDSISVIIPGVTAKAVDTTAAGDIFNGALAVAISEGRMIDEAVKFANKAASISVTRLGAQASAPYRYEID